jgi:plasmid maintenance system antidote protein VapI
MTPSFINFLVNENGGQTTVAKKIGCSQSQLAQIINGHRVNDRLRDKLATYLGISKERLFDAEFQAVVEYKRKAA